MLSHLDNLLRHLFTTRVPSITSEDQVRFQPPDQEWRTVVSNLGARNALNVYLVEMRENRKLRSNERVRQIEEGITHETPAPMRLDCYYLITAWSPARVTAAVEPALDEHQLLYEVTAVLMNPPSLIPKDIYSPGSLPAEFPPLIADAELPFKLLPVEGFPKYAEFWGTMGNIHPWKPAIYLVVTIPVALQREVAGPPVTTSISDARRWGFAETAEVRIQIGGRVLDTSIDPPSAVSNAWVRLETIKGVPIQTTATNTMGQFTFGGLQLEPGMPTGKYRLRYSAVNFSEKTRDVDLPSPTGEYDLRFP